MAASRVRLVSTERAPASSARNTGGASFAASERPTAVLRPPGARPAPESERHRSVLSHALAPRGRGERAVAPRPPPERPVRQEQHHGAHAGPPGAEQQDGPDRPRHPLAIVVLQEAAREADEENRAQREAEEHRRWTDGDVRGPGGCVSGFGLHSTKVADRPGRGPVPAAIETIASDSGPNSSRSRSRTLPRRVEQDEQPGGGAWDQRPDDDRPHTALVDIGAADVSRASRTSGRSAPLPPAARGP